MHLVRKINQYFLHCIHPSFPLWRDGGENASLTLKIHQQHEHLVWPEFYTFLCKKKHSLYKHPKLNLHITAVDSIQTGFQWAFLDFFSEVNGCINVTGFLNKIFAVFWQVYFIQFQLKNSRSNHWIPICLLHYGERYYLTLKRGPLGQWPHPYLGLSR